MVWLLAAVVAVAVAGLGVVVAAQRRRIEVLEDALAGSTGEEAVDVIAIEIRNHAQVAASRSAFARPLAAVTPGLLRSIVHRETLKMMRTELAENGVDADVRLRRIPVARPVREPDPEPDAEEHGL